MRKAKDGKVYYVDHNTRTTHWVGTAYSDFDYDVHVLLLRFGSSI